MIYYVPPLPSGFWKSQSNGRKLTLKAAGRSESRFFFSWPWKVHCGKKHFIVPQNNDSGVLSEKKTERHICSFTTQILEVISIQYLVRNWHRSYHWECRSLDPRTTWASEQYCSFIFLVAWFCYGGFSYVCKRKFSLSPLTLAAKFGSIQP